MTVFCDTSALLARHLDAPARRLALDTMAEHDAWCAAASALAEALVAVDRVTDEPVLRRELEDLLRLDWDRFHVVPLDTACLERAAALGREQPLRFADAVHLAAADRLPRPLAFLTFDPNQIPIALSLGFDVVSS
jgi:predicted nucleic acid-binding protein